MGHAVGRDNVNTLAQSDTELLTIFRDHPEQGWQLFIEKYADLILSHLRALGFDYDESMDRFVYVCEKLCEANFRRLRTIQYAGSRGDLSPWLRKVVKHLCINWAWSAQGRKRLFKPISRLPERERRIFELYFWKGMSPSEIYEQLRLDHQGNISLLGVLDSLERIFSVLSHKKLWRLMNNLARRRAPISLDEFDEETLTGVECVGPGVDPEEVLIRKEAEQRMCRALEGLSPREQLITQFRYEEGMAIKEIAEVLRISEQEVKGTVKATLVKLRRALK